MRRDEAILSITFRGETGLAILCNRACRYSVGNLPSSPVANMWSLDRDYGSYDTAVKVARRLAHDAGREIKEPVEERPGLFVMEFIESD